MEPSADHALPELGVGIVYSPAIEPVLRAPDTPVQVLEIEPQTMWLHLGGLEPAFKEPAGLLDYLAGLPGRKLVHSVGAPVGGTRPPGAAQMPRLSQWIGRLDAPWASEHLSFNETKEFHAGFFLAPRQTLAGVEAVVESVQRLQAALPVPVAIETGVNYLRPRADELLDGEFMAEVARRTGCGILLDLHNVYTNALNGRQPVERFLDWLPLERVWEIHLAGGLEMDGFWLDGHSDVIPDRLLGITQGLLPSLPNAKAMIFEVFPSFVPVMGLPKIRRQLEKMRDLWDNRRHARGTWVFQPSPPVRRSVSAAKETPEEWEKQLVRLVIGRAPGDSALSAELAQDPGVAVMVKLIREFRASMLVNVLRFTLRLLLLTLGEEGLQTVLRAFWAKVPPQFYATTEAAKFLEFMRETDLKVPRLRDVMDFEQALLATAMDDRPRVVSYTVDLLPLLRALAEGRLPDTPGREGSFEIEVTPDQLVPGGDGPVLTWGQSSQSN
jgi:uncharacterized protein (UPF0276 family)